MAAENAGTVTVQIRLALKQMEKDGLNAQKMIEKFAQRFNRQWQTAGDGFAESMQQGFDQVETVAGKLGESITGRLSPGIKMFQDLKQTIDDASTIGEQFADGFSGMENALAQKGAAAIGVFDQISGAALEISHKYAEEQTAIIEKALTSTLADIEKAREAELAANAETVEAQLAAMGLSGEEALAYRQEQREKEQEINDRYDAQAKAATEQAAKEKAKIAYALAVQEYAMNMVSAVNAGVMAVLQALSSAPPPYNIVLAGLSGAAAGAQIAALAGNPPQMPTFASGGIVPGNFLSGDNVLSRLNSREMVLPLEDQTYLYDEIHNRNMGEGGGPVSATIVLMLDGREIAQNTIDLVNKGHYTIEARAVR
jgi:hypothetical protein